VTASFSSLSISWRDGQVRGGGRNRGSDGRRRNGMGGVGSDRQLSSGQLDAAGNIHNLCVEQFTGYCNIVTATDVQFRHAASENTFI